MNKIQYMHPDSFDWLTWSGGRLLDLGIYNRLQSIVDNKKIIRKYAIGYLFGEKLICRPKKDTVAVMFFNGENEFWTHLTLTEFKECFPYIKT